MKRFLLIFSIASLLPVVNSIPTLGNNITVGNVIGSFGSGTIDTVMTGSSIKFYLRYENTSGLPLSIVNGFVVYSPNGATWSGPLIIDTTSGAGAPLTKSSGNFDLTFAASVFDGATRDTFGIGGVRLTGQGLPPGYNNMPYGLGIGSFDNAEDGLTVCIDSAYYRPAGEWRWSSPSLGNFAPSWGGPYCYEIITALWFPPFISNPPIDITGNHCQTLTFDFNASDPDPSPYHFELLSGPGTINPSSGVWTWDGAAPSDVGTSINIEVRACETIPVQCGFTAIVPIIVTGPVPDLPPVITMCPSSAEIMFEGWFARTHCTAIDDCLGSNVQWSTTALTGAGVNDQASITTDGWLTVTIGHSGGSRLVEIAAIASDGASADTCVFQYDVIDVPKYEIQIGEGLNVPRGELIDIPVYLNAAVPEGIGRFWIGIGWDQAAAMLTNVIQGEPFGPGGCAWEYFTYRFGAGAFPGCTAGCPSGLMSVVGMAETNNGTVHPLCNVPDVLPAELFSLRFQVSSDPTISCHTIPVQFFWQNCTDNTITSENGALLFVSDSVFAHAPGAGAINAIEGISFPTFLGAQEECVIDPDGGGPKIAPIRAIDFYNGRIDVLCADSNDCRGDINLNGIPYEVADLVRMMVFFTYGCGDFPPPECPLMIQCSDINADGMGMSVADLVFLIRVIIGDTAPLPRKAAGDVHLGRQGDVLTTESELGAALVIIEGQATPTLLAEGMEMRSHFDGVDTRILISAPFGQGVTCMATFHGPFLKVEGNILSVEVALPDGREVPKVLFDNLPSEFALGQNYPNPFNPGTIIEFSLPMAGDVRLEIYNLLGQEVVTLLDGMTEAGQHRVAWNGRDRDGRDVPSGVYLYRLAAGNVVEHRKMMLLR